MNARRDPPLSILEIMKLWKGLFYALWMADRAIPQQNLAAELASLLAIQPRAGVVPWLRGFWATMAREWTGIDVLRLEKFLLLVRRVLGASFAWMKASEGGWDEARVRDVLGLLREWPFALEEAPEDEDELMPKAIPAGMKVHVLDIWIDEAEKVGLLEDDDESRDVLRRIGALAEALEKGTTATAVRIRAKEALADERLPWNKAAADGIEGHGDEDLDLDDDTSWDGFND